MAKANQTTTVYEKLKEQIERGVYSPAESLPEVELANEFNVSRNTIKKALLMLENDAYVTIEPNKGAKVRSYSRKELLDYLELRVELESFIVQLAVPCFTAENIQQLDAMFDQMGACRETHDLIGYSALNQQFHSIIYDVCPNRAAADLLIRLKAQMRKYNAKTILVPGREALSYNEHKNILDAIHNCDAESARLFTRRHIENVRKTFEDNYSLLF